MRSTQDLVGFAALMVILPPAIGQALNISSTLRPNATWADDWPSASPTPPNFCCYMVAEAVGLNFWWTSTRGPYTATVVTSYVEYDNTVLTEVATITNPSNASTGGIGSIPSDIIATGNEYRGTVLAEYSTIASYPTTVIASPTPHLVVNQFDFFTGTYTTNTAGSASCKITYTGPLDYLSTANRFGLPTSYIYVEDPPVTRTDSAFLPPPPTDIISSLITQVPAITRSYPYFTECPILSGSGQPTVHIAVTALTSSSSTTVRRPGNAPGGGTSGGSQTTPEPEPPASTAQPAPSPSTTPVEPPSTSNQPENPPTTAQSPTIPGPTSLANPPSSTVVNPHSPPEDTQSSLENPQTPPGNTQTPPENTQTPPENTQTPPENTQVPPENTQTPPANPQTPPVNTQVPPGNTQLPPGNTQAPPANTQVPPENTQVPPGNTQAPPANTPAPPQNTQAPSPVPTTAGAPSLSDVVDQSVSGNPQPPAESGGSPPDGVSSPAGPVAPSNTPTLPFPIVPAPLPTAAPTNDDPTNSNNPPISGGSTSTPAAGGVILPGDQTLNPGQQTTISGVVISVPSPALPASDATLPVVIVDGTTSTVAAAQPTSPPLVVVDGTTITLPIASPTEVDQPVVPVTLGTQVLTLEAPSASGEGIVLPNSETLDIGSTTVVDDQTLVATVVTSGTSVATVVEVADESTTQIVTLPTAAPSETGDETSGPIPTSSGLPEFAGAGVSRHSGTWAWGILNAVGLVVWGLA